jgi:hypothetical protein
MRAREFIREEKSVISKPMHPNYQDSLPGVHRVSSGPDRIYDLNRIMMAVAATDGITKPEVPDSSWGGRTNIATPYTREESDMLKMAYQVIGVDWNDILPDNANNVSQERSSTNLKSPLQGFKGYPR